MNSLLVFTLFQVRAQSVQYCKQSTRSDFDVSLHTTMLSDVRLMQTKRYSYIAHVDNV